DFVLEEDLPGIKLSIQEALQKRSAYKLHYRIRHKSGQIRTVEETGCGIFENDKLVALQGYFVDVTESHRARATREVFAEFGQRLAAIDSQREIGEVVCDTVRKLWQ